MPKITTYIWIKFSSQAMLGTIIPTLSGHYNAHPILPYILARFAILLVVDKLNTTYKIMINTITDKLVDMTTCDISIPNPEITYIENQCRNIYESQRDSMQGMIFNMLDKSSKSEFIKSELGFTEKGTRRSVDWVESFYGDMIIHHFNKVIRVKGEYGLGSPINPKYFKYESLKGNFCESIKNKIQDRFKKVEEELTDNMLEHAQVNTSKAFEKIINEANLTELEKEACIAKAYKKPMRKQLENAIVRAKKKLSNDRFVSKFI